VVSAITSVLSGVFAVVPSLPVAIIVNILIALCLAIVGPGILAALSLALPPRARAMGFSMSSLWILPGLVMLPFTGWIADTWGIRTGMAAMVPVFFVGGLVLASGGKLIAKDIAQVRQTALARAEAAQHRRAGTAQLLLIRGVSAGYGGVRVLHDIELDVTDGSVVALLGTNGAGKSTLLKAISGVVEADQGAVILDGRDITHAPPNEIAGLGVVQMPGGAGVFPGLTVKENLDAAEWLRRGRGGHSRNTLESDRRRAMEVFPEIAARLDDRAGNLSGGQQQMLALSMALLMQPRLLMIDELSLGLAPIVVERLLDMVRSISATGVTIILVEQSVNVALQLAETAVFLERGRIRFHGSTAELSGRNDLLRSVFLSNAIAASGAVSTSTGEAAHTPDLEAPAILSADGLTRSFGGIAAVAGVSLSVAASEIVGFIGPNGAGKTTLFDLLGGSTATGSGRIELGGVDVTRLPPSVRARRGLGRSFQDAELFASLTVEDTLAVALERWVTWGDPVTAALHLPMAFDSEAKIAARVDELSALMGLEPYRHTRIRALSTGTRRVVDLACVVAHRPTVVLLDEPSSGIAQREVEALGPVLCRIRDEMGSALLVIEHDMGLLAEVSDRIIALDQGVIIAQGHPADVLADPAVIDAYLGTESATIERSGPTTTPPGAS
jgi:ABC-type branched-subunit amino acid transport system ATPase component